MSRYVETAEDIKISIEELKHNNYHREFVITVQGKNMWGKTYMRQDFVSYAVGHALKLKLEEIK